MLYFIILNTHFSLHMQQLIYTDNMDETLTRMWNNAYSPEKNFNFIYTNLWRKKIDGGITTISFLASGIIYLTFAYLFSECFLFIECIISVEIEMMYFTIMADAKTIIRNFYLNICIQTTINTSPVDFIQIIKFSILKNYSTKWW